METVREEERGLLQRLLQLYLYDFSEIDPDDVEESGEFAYEHLDRYGREPGHHALLLRAGGKPAGFALVDDSSPLEGSADRRYIHEFHVLRAYRGRGLGRAMARAIFDRYPGDWQIEQIGPNTDAQRFWRRILNDYTGGRYTEHTRQAKRFPLVIQEFSTNDRVGE